jgi:DNA repair protein RadC
MIVSQGSADTVPVPVREILNAVLRCDGRAFAIAHNHPAGVVGSSDVDVSATERLAVAARTVGLRFLGHVVVAGDYYEMVSPVSASRTPN